MINPRELRLGNWIYIPKTNQFVTVSLLIQAFNGTNALCMASAYTKVN